MAPRRHQGASAAAGPAAPAIVVSIPPNPSSPFVRRSITRSRSTLPGGSAMPPEGPPPWFFLALFPVLAASAGIVIVSIGATIQRIKRGKTVVQVAPPVPDAQVARLQAEVDELRVQVERLTAAES